MKAYLVCWCNNERWEDYYETVDAVFLERDKAVAFIVSKGYHPHACKGEWERRNMADRYDSEIDEFGEYSSMWVREMDVSGL